MREIKEETVTTSIRLPRSLWLWAQELGIELSPLMRETLERGRAEMSPEKALAEVDRQIALLRDRRAECEARIRKKQAIERDERELDKIILSVCIKDPATFPAPSQMTAIWTQVRARGDDLYAMLAKYNSNPKVIERVKQGWARALALIAEERNKAETAAILHAQPAPAERSTGNLGGGA